MNFRSLILTACLFAPVVSTITIAKSCKKEFCCQKCCQRDTCACVNTCSCCTCGNR